MDTARREKMYVVIFDEVHDEFVDNSEISDFTDAINELENDDIVNALNAAWKYKDYDEFIHLIRCMMYTYFESQAVELSTYYTEYGERKIA